MTLVRMISTVSSGVRGSAVASMPTQHKQTSTHTPLQVRAITSSCFFARTVKLRPSFARRFPHCFNMRLTLAGVRLLATSARQLWFASSTIVPCEAAVHTSLGVAARSPCRRSMVASPLVAS